MDEVIKRFIDVSQKYYTGLNTGMDDASYDKLHEQVLEIDPNFDVFKHLDLSGTDRTDVEHYLDFVPQEFKIPFYSMEEIIEIIKSSDRIPTYKMDGTSIRAYYSDGKLYDIVTRSGEFIGKRKFDSLYNKFPSEVDPNVMCIDAEATCSIDDFGDNARSNSNGLINSCYKQDEVDKFIIMIPFKVTTKSNVNYIDSFKLCGYSELDIPLVNLNDLKTFEDRYIIYKGKRILIDGFVLYDKLNQSTPHQIYKYYSNQEVSTEVVNIDWRFNDKLNWVPTLEVDDILLDGRNVGRVTSNGYGRLKELKAGVGSVITVVLANSTIPQLSKVISESEDYNLPEKCEFCGAELIEVNNKLRCSNKYCKKVMDVISKGYLLNMLGEDIFNNEEIYELTLDTEDALRGLRERLVNKGYTFDKSKIAESISHSAIIERLSSRAEEELTELLKELMDDIENNKIKFLEFDDYYMLTQNQYNIFEGYLHIYDLLIKIFI